MSVFKKQIEVPKKRRLLNLISGWKGCIIVKKKKVFYSILISLIVNHFLCDFLQPVQRIQNQNKILLFLYVYGIFLPNIFLAFYHLLEILELSAAKDVQRNGLLKTPCLRFSFCKHLRLGIIKLLKSLHSSLHRKAALGPNRHRRKDFRIERGTDPYWKSLLCL